MSACTWCNDKGMGGCPNCGLSTSQVEQEKRLTEKLEEMAARLVAAETEVGKLSAALDQAVKLANRNHDLATFYEHECMAIISDARDVLSCGALLWRLEFITIRHEERMEEVPR